MNNNSANRYEEGYLIREIPIKSLNIEEATPPVAELQAFNQVSNAIDVSLPVQSVACWCSFRPR